MSSMIENRRTNEINDKDREHFSSFDTKEDYSFKYVPESHFKYIVKNIQRQRRKEDEERIWTSFVKEQELNNLRIDNGEINWPPQNVKELLKENIHDVDRELKRLQEDALPEQYRVARGYQFNVENDKTYAETSKTKTNFAKEKLPMEYQDAEDTRTQENISNYIESEGSKRVARQKAKKSVSDPLILQKKCYTNQILCATDDHLENNSDSDFSNNKSNIINIQPDPLMVQKILSMQKKIAELLDDISFRLCKIPLPDGDNDLKRRQQQTMEFGIRFSRNYLYNLKRFVTSIQRHIGVMSLDGELKHHHKNVLFHQDIMKQKLIAVHQLLIQALTAYCKHIPNSMPESHLTRFQSIYQIISKLNDICDKVEIFNDYFCSGDANIFPMENNLQEKCNTILSKLKSCLENKRRCTNYANVESAVALAPMSLRNRKRLNQKNLSSRLSMYSMDIKGSKINQRKKIDCRRTDYYARERKCNAVGVTSTYNQHSVVPEVQYPSPVTHRSSSRDVQIDLIKSAGYLKEDDIKTAMDSVSIDSENGSNVEIQTKRTNETKTEQQFIGLKKKSSTKLWKSKNVENKETNMKIGNTTSNDELINKVTAVTTDHLSTLVPLISDLMTLLSKKQGESDLQHVSGTSIETLLEILQKYQSLKDPRTKASTTDDSSEHFNLKLHDKSSEIQRQVENVQLICMTSVDKVPRMEQRDASCQADYESTMRTNSDKIAMGYGSKWTGIQLDTSKETEQHFLSYKRKYQRLCESKPMYSSNTQNKPWDIVVWISDKLMEELIIEIAKELQMKSLIKKLFEMEFQEF